MGTFLSPDYQDMDDDDTPEAIPNGAVTNPQTLNLYSYVQNNPLTQRDYDGHASWQPCSDGSGDQCWTGDYNGEYNNGLFWNSQTQQWQQNDPVPPPDNWGSVPATVIDGFYRATIAQSGEDFYYGAHQMLCGALGGGGSRCSAQTGQDYAATVIAAGPVTKPDFVPNNWVQMPSNKGTGVKWVDPNNPHNSVRLEPAKPGSSNPGQQQDYMVVTKNGQTLDMNGNIVPRQSLESHIPQGTELPPDTFVDIP